MSRKKIFIGICNSQEHVPADFFWSMWDVNRSHTMQVNRCGHPWDVVRNNRLIHTFLESDFDVFVKMDIDQRYPRNYFEDMVPLVDKYKVIGPLLYDRWPSNKYMPLMFETVDYPRITKWDMNGHRGIVSVPYAHTNMFYAREVLESLEMPWYEAYMTSDGLDRANHVDFTFLDKIKDKGYKIYVNLEVIVEHLAMSRIGKEFHERWQDKS